AASDATGDPRRSHGATDTAAEPEALCVFFSSRRRHTRCGRDWSSDVCLPIFAAVIATTVVKWLEGVGAPAASSPLLYTNLRSEERRVGKECRSRWSPYH